MRRIASHYTYSSPYDIKRTHVLEIDEDGFLAAMFDLSVMQVESANTLFCDGIISSSIVSLKQHCSQAAINQLQTDYNYIDLTDHSSFTNFYDKGKKLLLDFGTNDPLLATDYLVKNSNILKNFHFWDVIAGSVYYPSMILNKSSQIEIGSHLSLIVWRNIDFTNSVITSTSSINFI
jgi:hypothetical protein